MLQKGQIWETRPLEFYAKAKELRSRWENTAEDKDMVVGQGNTGFQVDWQQCFPCLFIMEDNPRGSTIAAKNLPEARRFRLASESRGWAGRYAVTKARFGASNISATRLTAHRSRNANWWCPYRQPANAIPRGAYSARISARYPAGRAISACTWGIMTKSAKKP